MAKASLKNNSLSKELEVKAFVEKLEPGLAKAVEAVKKVILAADKNIAAHIKWNNPAFYYTGPMPEFDAKEYKADIAVFNLFKGRIMLVFPHGAGLDDPLQILEGNFKDGRRTLIFKDETDVKKKAKALAGIIRSWINNIDKTSA